jgi:hypothetical protein
MKGKLRVLAILLAFTMVLTSVQVPVKADAEYIDVICYDEKETIDVYTFHFIKGASFNTSLVVFPTHEDAVFYCWEKEDGSRVYTQVIEESPMQSTKLIAYWKYNIYLNNSNIGENVDKLTAISGEKVTLPTLDERTGDKTYTFAGWRDSDGNSVTEYEAYATTTFYARWKFNYDVALNANGGTVLDDKGNTVEKLTLSSETYTCNGTDETSTITLPKPSRPGWRFKGWTVEQQGENGATPEPYEARQEIEVKSDMALTAEWEPCETHSFGPTKGDEANSHTCTWCDLEVTHTTFTNEDDADGYHKCTDCNQPLPHTPDPDNGQCTAEGCDYQQALIKYETRTDDKETVDGEIVSVTPSEGQYVYKRDSVDKVTKPVVTIDDSPNADNLYYRFLYWTETTKDPDGSKELQAALDSLVPQKPENSETWAAETTYTAVFQVASSVIKVTSGDDEKIYTSWDDALNNIKDGDTVTVLLCDDTDVTDKVISDLLEKLADPTDGDDIVLDLNGHKLFPVDGEEPSAIVIDGSKLEDPDRSELTVIDSSKDNSGVLELPIRVEKGGTLILDGCTVKPDGDSVPDDDLGLDAVIIVEKGGKLVLEDEAKVIGDPENDVVGIITKSDDVSLEVGSEVKGGGTIDDKHSPTGKEEEVGAIVYVQPEGSDKTLDDLIHGDNEKDVKDVGTDSIVDPDDANNKIEFTTGEDVKVEEKPAVTPSSNPGSVSGIVIPTTTDVAAATAADDDAAGSVIRNATGVSGLAASSGGTGTTASTSKSFLHLKATKATKTTQSLSWTKVAGATTYKIYGTDCGSDDYKLLKTVKSTSSRTWKRTGLPANTYYKYYVVAYKQQNGKLVKLAKSNVIHETTTNTEYGNPTRITVDLDVLEVTVKVKKTVTLSADVTYPKSKEINLNHAKLVRYRSSNKKIATVKSNGTITGKKAGTCYIYCYAVNGIYKKVKVTVTK